MKWKSFSNNIIFCGFNVWRLDLKSAAVNTYEMIKVTNIRESAIVVPLKNF